MQSTAIVGVGLAGTDIPDCACAFTVDAPAHIAELKAAMKQLPLHAPRIHVWGDDVYGDAILGAVITRLMVSGRLDIEVAYIPSSRTPGARRLGLVPHQLPSGLANPLPIIKDDLGFALVAQATITGGNADKFTGETYVDDERLFTGTAGAVDVEVTKMGVRARKRNRILRGKWVHGRAAQTGGIDLRVTRDGLVQERLVPRSTFYRHVDDWILVK